MTNAPGLKALLLDMGGVLLHRRRDKQADELIDRLVNILEREPDEQAARRLAQLELGLAGTELNCALLRIAESYEPDRRMWHLLSERRACRKTAILNNGSSIALPAFDKLFGIFGATDLFMNSAIEGVGKPDSRFFLRACERLGVSPKECLFVDDLPAHTIAAEQLGMRTICWTDRMRCYEQLVSVLDGHA